MVDPQHFRSAYEGKKVFVTGHTGFKGSWLTTWLVQLGAEVTGYALPPLGDQPLFNSLGLGKAIIDIRADIRDLPTLRETLTKAAPDYIFHLAAQPLVRASYREPIETYETNVLGTAKLLEACRALTKSCAVVCVTTDKCYLNREQVYAYREEDSLGGHDPYSASKAAAEIVIASYRDSFFSAESPVRIASARAGNVLGGGDWAEDRIVPDCIRALQKKQPIAVRNPNSTRPWQHVLEPLGGYLALAAAMQSEPQNRSLQSAFNFGPGPDSNRTVRDLVTEILRHWPGESWDASDARSVHEAGRLNLNIEKARRLLRWQPVWSFAETIQKTVVWYRQFSDGAEAGKLCRNQIKDYTRCTAMAQPGATS